MDYLLNRLCFISVLLISALTECSSYTIPPDPIIVVNHTYEINMSQEMINIEIKNVTKEVIRELQISVNAKTDNFIKEFEISSISPGHAKKISIKLDGKPYPKDLRIYVKGYYKKFSKNNLFICDYPLEQ